jgi:phage shock protein A
MSVFKRLSDIVAANIHHLLDRCEDPEKMCKQVVRELEDNLVQVRFAVAKAMASERQLRQGLDQSRELAAEWTERAERAVGEGDEALARRALRQAVSQERAARRLQQDWEEAAAGAEELRAQLVILEQKLREARRYRDMLVARRRVAEAKQRMAGSLRDFSAFGERMQQLGQLAEVVRQLELEVAAEVELRTEEEQLGREFQARDEDGQVERELQALRQRLSPPPPDVKHGAGVADGPEAPRRTRGPERSRRGQHP